jgi:hypothetical protein
MSNNEGIAKLRAKSGEDTLISFREAFGVRTRPRVAFRSRPADNLPFRNYPGR